jgi:hypothetical protein
MFKTPLPKRMRNAARYKEQYHSDPDFRLRMVNRVRAINGRPPVSDLPPIGQCPRWNQKDA